MLVFENQVGSHGGLSEELATYLSLPKVKIPIFNGDPREHHMFITTFDQVVGNVLSSDQATILYQYLSGEARSAVKAFAQIGGGAGYAKTRQVLKCRFGSSYYLVAQCVIDDLRKGDPATNSRELRALADELASALQTLTQLGAYGEVNTQQFICEIVMRCHPHVCSSWCRLALDNHENRNVYPTFEQFATFMDKVAREACDPVYGFDAFKITSKWVSVNLVTESSSMKDDVVPSCISPKLGPFEERMSDVSSMQVNHVMMDEPSDRVDKLWNIERHDDTGPMLKEPGVWLSETGPVLKEPGVWLSETGPVLKEPGVWLSESGPVLKEPGVWLSESGPVLKEPAVMLSETGHMLKQPGVMSRETGPVLKEPGVRLSETGHMLKQPGVMSRETGPVLKEPGVWLSESGPVLKEPEVMLSETGHMLKQPGVMSRETGPVLKEPGVRLSVGVELSDSDVKKVVCNVLVVEEVKEYHLDKLIANCSDLYRLETDVAWMIGWGLMVEDSCGLMVEESCGLMVDKEVRLGRDEWV